MVRFQIVPADGELFEALKHAMRSGELRTFQLEKHGKRITHVSAPGWINWEYAKGVINCEILSPYQPGREWQILSNLIGRLANRFAERVHSIHIQFEPAEKPRTMSKKAGR